VPLMPVLDAVAAQQPAPFLGAQACAARYAVSPSTWWRWTRAGRAPQPLRLGPGAIARWRLCDLLIWEIDGGYAAPEPTSRVAG